MQNVRMYVMPIIIMIEVDTQKKYTETVLSVQTVVVTCATHIFSLFIADDAHAPYGEVLKQVVIAN